MKKIYQHPTITIVKLNSGTICQLMVGSGNTESTRGNGVDLTKENQNGWGNIWDDSDE